jgi:DNA-binding Lrp family transcriptional regulator
MQGHKGASFEQGGSYFMENLMKNICTKCSLIKSCEGNCPALDRLFEVYEEMRTEVKTDIIKELRPQLDIKDAETAEDIRELAEQIIKRIPELSIITDFNIKVGYVRSFERKIKDGQVVFGECRKVSKTYGAYLPYDFIITLYEPNIALLTDNQIKILLWHELKHIGIGDRGFMVNPHEIEDFLSITDAHGTRWNHYGQEVIDILADKGRKK